MDSGKNMTRKPGNAGGKKANRWDLEIASFLCGAAVMVLEMAGSRVVAPYVGTSLIVWTSLIGVIMASLSLGYWLGGKAADLRPEQKMLAKIVLLASLFTGIMALLSNPILKFLSRNITNIYLSSVIGALLIFAMPSILLGMVSPFIVRLAIRDVGSSGATVGRFSALSSTGSILGTFLGGFILISFFSSGVILLLVAAVLAFVALLLYRSAWKKAVASCVAFLTLVCGVQWGIPMMPSPWDIVAAWHTDHMEVNGIRARFLMPWGMPLGIPWGMPMMPPGEHMDTPYNHIWVAEHTRDSGRRARFLMTDAYNEGAQSIIYTDNPSELVSAYTKFYDLAFYYKPDAQNILMLGGGGYCVPRHLLATRSDDLGLPTFSMDVVEIDPGITATARKYFSLQDSPALSIYHEDARVFLNRAAMNPGMHGPYDAIFADVFGSWYAIPFHMTTVEAAQNMADLLTPDGVLVSNVISSLYGGKSRVLHGIYAALSQVFPRVLIFMAQRPPDPNFSQVRQNIMVVAFKSADEMPILPPYDPEIARLLSHRWTNPFVPEIGAFTDAFAPVENYALQ